MKAIELVYRAQPMIAALREVASQCQGAKHGNAVVADCDEWLDHARDLMRRKGIVTGPTQEGGAK